MFFTLRLLLWAALVVLVLLLALVFRSYLRRTPTPLPSPPLTRNPTTRLPSAWRCARCIANRFRGQNGLLVPGALPGVYRILPTEDRGQADGAPDHVNTGTQTPEPLDLSTSQPLDLSTSRPADPLDRDPSRSPPTLRRGPGPPWLRSRDTWRTLGRVGDWD